MIKRTDEEIITFAKELWGDRPFANFEVNVVQENDVVKLTVSRMYDPPDLAFEQLYKLAEFFGTNAINDDDRFSQEGCETCDWGSAYGFTLTIRPEQPLKLIGIGAR